VKPGPTTGVAYNAADEIRAILIAFLNVGSVEQVYAKAKALQENA